MVINVVFSVEEEWGRPEPCLSHVDRGGLRVILYGNGSMHLPQLAVLRLELERQSGLFVRTRGHSPQTSRQHCHIISLAEA